MASAAKAMKMAKAARAAEAQAQLSKELQKKRQDQAEKQMRKEMGLDIAESSKPSEPPKPKPKPPPKPVDWLPHRDKALKIYQNKYLQLFIALIIIGNFLAIVTEKEIDPYPPERQFYPAVWISIDDFCNWIFVFELLLNLYGSFWRPFLASAW